MYPTENECPNHSERRNIECEEWISDEDRLDLPDWIIGIRVIKCDCSAIQKGDRYSHCGYTAQELHNGKVVDNQ